MSKTSQSYILTYYRPENELINGGWHEIHRHLWQKGCFLYIGSQLERCPTTNKLHWQAFVKFERSKKQKVTWFHNNGLAGVHGVACSIERAEAINYGCKEESRVEGPMESGEKPAPKNSAKKFEDCKEAILENRKQDVPFQMVCQYRLEQRWKALQAFYYVDKRESIPKELPNPWGLQLKSDLLMKKRHYWIFSRQPNKGKTYLFAKPLAKNYKVSLEVGEFNYWNVEDTTEAVILDEYNHAAIKYSSLNSMCDGTFQYRIFQKGKICLPDPLIIVLSNQSISDIYIRMNFLLYERFNEIEIL